MRSGMCAAGPTSWRRAGTARDLEVPASVSSLWPPHSPGLNPVETPFPILRCRHLPNQVSGITRVTARESAMP